MKKRGSRLSIAKINKRGQEVFGLSFGMIFAIILIIAFIGVAVYVIYYFISLSNCTKVGLFYDDLETEIEKSWKSDGPRTEDFESSVPSGVTKVCFGNLTQSAIPTADQAAQKSLDDEYYQDVDNNIFFYPSDKACDGDGASTKLQHVTIQKFFCVPVKNDVAKVRLQIGSRETLVTLKELPT